MKKKQLDMMEYMYSEREFVIVEVGYLSTRISLKLKLDQKLDKR
jgi:hypothetical protein